MAIVWALRRIRAEAFIAAAAALAVGLALVLLASGPIFADAVSTGALRRALLDAPTADTAIDITTRIEVAGLTTVDDVVTDSVVDATIGTRPTIHRTITAAETFALPDQPTPDRVDLAQLIWVENVRDHATLVDGSWPEESALGNGSVPVAVDAGAAATLGLEIGRLVPLTPRTATASEVAAVIVGHYEVDQARAPFWHERGRLVAPITITSSFRTISLLTVRTVLEGGASPRPEIDWLVLPGFARLELDDVEPLRRRVGRLESTINAQLFERDSDEPITVSVTTAIPEALAGRDRTLSVARAVVFATIVQLSALAAFALALVAGLGVDARRAESALLRARGASAPQLTGQSGVDALVIVVPVALVAPLVASRLVGLFDEFGPLESIGLELDPRAGAAAWTITAVAAVLTIGLLTWPAARAARAAASTDAGARRRAIGSLQRSGLDLAVLAAAGFAYWQLRVLDDDRTATVRDRFGVDPMLIVAPAFGLVAGAFLALRLLPVLSRAAETVVTRRRGAVGALAMWQLARRPHRYTRTTLLVTMAVSVGVFASSYESTWSSSQDAQAQHQVAADARLTPNRRTGESIPALQLPAALDAVGGVDDLMSVVRLPADLPGADRPGRLVALDVEAAAVLNEGTAGPELDAAFTSLAGRRPELPGIDLPGVPTGIELTTDVFTVDMFGERIPPDPDVPPETPLPGSLSLTIVDGDGMLHVVSAGPLGIDTSTRRIELAVPTAETAPALPRAPLRIVDLQLDSFTQGARSRDVRVEIGPLTVIDASGERVEVPLAGVPLVATSEALGFLATPASATVAERDSERALAITVTTGSSLAGVPVIHTVAVPGLPTGATVAGVADRAWASAANVTIGDLINASTDRIDGLRIEIVGVVDVVPTVDPNVNPAVMVDLPSMQWVERSPGRGIRPISEYWLDLAPDARGVADALSQPPIEALEVTLLSRRRADLTSNPPALGSLGALGVGFIAALVFATTALVVTAVVSARERRAEFAVLEALGLSDRDRRRWLFREQVAIVVVGVLAGTAVGVGLSLLVLPVVSLSQDGSTVFPPVIVLVPWRRVLVLAAAVAATSLAGVVLALVARTRRSPGTSLRTGVEP